MYRNPLLYGRDVSVFVEIQDEGDELWIYDPENMDDTYAVVYYGAPGDVAEKTQECDTDLARVVATSRKPRVAYLSSIVISRELRAKGLGTEFVKLLLSALRKRRVSIVWLNALRSFDFWTRFGFVHEPDSDALLPGMRLDLQ